MKIEPLCDPYVWENPKVLMYTGFVRKSSPYGDCVSEMVNHIVFIYLVAFALGGVFVMTLGGNLTMPAALFVAFVYTAPTLWALAMRKREVDGFQVDKLKEEAEKAAVKASPQLEKKWGGDKAADLYDVIGGGLGAPARLTLPSARNPFMNVLVDEIKYHPTRPMAASIQDPSVRVTLDEFFRTDFYSDPTDVFGRSQSQREFITMPSTSIPNDRDSFQNWLYKIPGKTCKEGGREACLPGTDGAAIPWLNALK